MGKKYRLLVIDDSEETVAGLEHFFSINYEVFTAADGMEGLKFFETAEEGFDLVITDLVMPLSVASVLFQSSKRNIPAHPSSPSPAGVSIPAPLQPKPRPMSFWKNRLSCRNWISWYRSFWQRKPGR